jgi:hypothetical protein
MGEKKEIAMRAPQTLQSRGTRDSRRDQERVDALRPRNSDLALHRGAVAGERGRVACRMSGLFDGGAYRRRAGRDPLLEGRKCLIGEAVIVLEIIDPAERQIMREFSQGFRRQSLRLERRGGERPGPSADPLAQSREALARPIERRDKISRKIDIDQRDVFVQRRIAEEHVHQLASVAADRRDSKRDLDLEDAAAAIDNVPRFANDVGKNLFVADRRQGRFDALLDRNGAGALLDRVGARANSVCRD